MVASRVIAYHEVSRGTLDSPLEHHDGTKVTTKTELRRTLKAAGEN